MSNEAYPERPPYFAHKFTRLLFRSCVGAQIGPDATLLLIAIVHCEDARRYSGPVSFFAGNLADQIGLSISSMERARAKAIEAGWLHHIPGAKRRAAQYWVMIPPSEAEKPDGPLDEGEEILRQVDGVSGEYLTEQAVSIRGECDGVSGEYPNHLLPLPSSSPLPCVPSSSTTGDAATKPTKPKTAKPKPSGEAKAATHPHSQAIAIFCDRWAAKYGVKYPFAGGKDGTAVKWMLSQVDGNLDRFAAIVDRYLADADPFYADARHPLGHLRAQFARWLVDTPSTKPKPSTSFDGPSVGGPPLAELFASQEKRK